jgi:hypothetical protein
MGDLFYDSLFGDNSNIPSELQWTNTNTYAPHPPLNAGIFTGVSFQGVWGNVHTSVIPTETNSIFVNLLTANPPKGVDRQLPNQNRPGNNFTHLKNH